MHLCQIKLYSLKKAMKKQIREASEDLLLDGRSQDKETFSRMAHRQKEHGIYGFNGEGIKSHVRQLKNSCSPCGKAARLKYHMTIQRTSKRLIL